MAFSHGQGPAGSTRAHAPIRHRAGSPRIVVSLAAICSALALAACGGSSNSNSNSGGGTTTGSGGATTGANTSTVAQGTPQAGGSITVLESSGFAGDWPAGLDPATNTNGAADQSQMNAIFGEPFELGSDGKLHPDLFTAYKFSDGGKTVTMKLRKGVKFSDGTPFNAQAVVFNWKRDLKSTCTCKPIIQVDSIAAPDPTTVVLKLKLPDGAFVNALQDSNFSWIASPAALKKMGEKKFKLAPVGAGPFTVSSDTLSSQLVLKKNPKYWQKGRPYLDGLTFKTTQDDETALEAMQAGQGQAYEGMSTVKLVPTFKSKFQVTGQPGTSPYDIQLNTKIPPFNNKQARLAIYYATNGPLLDDKLFNNAQPVGQSFTAAGGLFYTKTVPGYPTYNLAKAKAIVKQLGGLKVDFFSIQQSATQNMMIALQQMWKQAGIQSSIHLYSLAGLIQQFGGKWQAALQTAGAWDPAGGVGVAFRFASTSPFSGVHDPKLDALINKGAAEVNPAQRNKTYAQTAAYIAKNAYGPFLFPVTSWSIAAKGLQGPGLTTSIPAVAVNTGILWPDVAKSGS